MREQFEGRRDQKKKSDKKPHNKGGPNWTDEEIDDMLGIVKEKMEQVEGNFVFNLAGSRRMLPFDNHTVENIPKREYYHYNLRKKLTMYKANS